MAAINVNNSKLSYNLVEADEYNCAHTSNGWKVIFPTIEITDNDDDQDRRFKKLYAAAIEESEYEILRHAEYMSKNGYLRGQWHKAVNASFCAETQHLHDFVMGHNHCDDLIFHLEVIDQRTIKVS